eukprot:3777041-Alexandrium_andersonii.AAC.1
MVSRMLLILLMLMGKKAAFILEQPASSLMRRHERFKHAAFARVEHTHTWMGCFGGPSPKPTKLYSNATWTRKLERRMTQEVRTHMAANTDLVHNSEKLGTYTGEKAVSGGRGLKPSQEYPIQYAIAVADAFAADRKSKEILEIEESSDSDYEGPNDGAPDLWEDCNLRDLAGFCNVSFEHMPSGI